MIKKPTYRDLPARVYAEAVPRKPDGLHLHDYDDPLVSERVQAFHSAPAVVAEAARSLAEAGFDVVHVAPTSITIAGPPSAYEKAFGARLHLEEVELEERGEHRRTATHLRSAHEDGTRIEVREGALAEFIEGVALHRPVGRNSISPTPLAVPYYHLDPDTMLDALRVRDAHALGITGKGVRVVSVDSGCYQYHPWFTSRGHAPRVLLSPGATDPHEDSVGHGTMVCANIYTTAPDVRLTMVKQTAYNIDVAFKMAIDLEPDVLENTWGFPAYSRPLSYIEKVTIMSVAEAIRRGIIVVFAGGNSKISLPPQQPDVLAVGGAFVHEDGSLEASNYASGYMSDIFPGRIVPDVCGLVGMQPEGVYLMLPTAPRSQIDTAFAGEPFPEKDDTGPADGWVGISGTSAGSAQLAGICALLKQADPSLTQAGIKQLLIETARHVSRGTSAEGNPAGPESPNLATGFGLVDATAAIKAAIRWRGWAGAPPRPFSRVKAR